jgi:magnesium-transporting ATPase (P-type)
MTPEKRTEIIDERVVKKFAAKTYRTLLVSYCDYSEADWENMKASNNNFETAADKEVVEAGLNLVGIFALVDPLRPGIPESVDRCHQSGINVRMVTGDNIDTAIAISKEAHILSQDDLADNEDGYVCMTGEKFRDMIGGEVILGEEGKIEVVIKNQRAFRNITKKLKVLARSLPDDKFMLVHGLIEEGATVAVTGDGTNDAPALHRADVGFAMGIAGTDVAKNAADIVLTDDNFCSIEVAIKYGRNIFDNVRKFLQFQLTVNVAALIIVFTGSVIFDDPPLTSV